MNGDQRTNAALLAKVIEGWQGKHNAEVVVCAPMPYFEHTQGLIAAAAIVLGAQSVSEHAGGAYTGEVSARMLAEWQCRDVIVGHNERRRMQQESDVQVAEKFIAVQREQL